MNKNFEKVRLVADPYPPYQFEENGKVNGIDYDIIAAAFKEVGIDTETKLLPWEFCIRSMENKEADGIFQIVSTPQREMTFLFSHPFRTAKTVLFHNSRTPIPFNNRADIGAELVRYKLGALSGYSYTPEIDHLKAPMKIEVQNNEILLKGLTRNDFDLIIIDLGVAEYLMKKLDITGIERVEGYEITRALHVAFQKRLRNIVDLFNTGLRTIKEKGLYIRIFQKYGVGDY